MATVLGWCRGRRLQERGLASPRRVSLLFLWRIRDDDGIRQRKMSFFPQAPAEINIFALRHIRNAADFSQASLAPFPLANKGRRWHPPAQDVLFSASAGRDQHLRSSPHPKRRRLLPGESRSFSFGE